MNEKDKQNLFLYDTSSSLSTPTQVKPGILREFNIFRQECKIYVNNQKNNDINSGNSSSTQGELGSLDRSKRFKSSSKIYRSIMGTIACNNKDDEEKFNFRQTYYSKPTMNDDNNLTDWSFNQEDVFDYNTISNDNKIFDQFMIQEASHIYITQQRLYHFFQKRMAIKSQDIHKFIFQLQSTLEWHLEQLYEFTMKTRITKLLFDSFVNSFKKSILENGEDLINKVHWLVNYIKESNYKPSGYSHSLD
ncbi:unnamed protein product [Rotaria magnacalcarata]|uniref:Uncharacterized protein n=3 Tax=Rotaria magnacalcarata TaxID=392030 RepID=A0A814P790_9BILA|nr:unnamed protein product [Rotaria magnacalcarata]